MEKEQKKEENFDTLLLNDLQGLSLEDACECCNCILDSLEYASDKKCKFREITE